MKARFFLLLLLLLLLFVNNKAIAQESLYIKDGQNTDFAWGRQIAFDKIAIGLSDEGIYELRNDTMIWVVGHPTIEDQPLRWVRKDEQGMKNEFIAWYPSIFERHIESSPFIITGTYEVNGNRITNDKGEHVASILPNGEVIAPDGNVYFRINYEKSNPVLTAFFFIFHYLPRVQR